MPDHPFLAMLTKQRIAGMLVVLILHGAALFMLWQHKLVPVPEAFIAPVFVNFIAPPSPQVKEPAKPQPAKPRPVPKPAHQPLAIKAPATLPTDFVVPAAPDEPSPPAPEPVPAPPQMAMPSSVTISGELAVTCPERNAPSYPPFSRRLGETGMVVLRVELNEQGRVALATVKTSSGYARLDEAALAAVKTWRCTPATRNGQPVRATALQPFNFILQGN